MVRFVPPIAVVLFLFAGCNRVTTHWRPVVASQVPDSTPVRFARDDRAELVAGRALDWHRRSPKLVTARGDTVVIPAGATLSVRLKEKEGHPVVGAILGAIVGVGIEYAACPPPKRYCGEENPTELLAAGVGGLVGSVIKTDHWVRVRWDPR